MKKALIVAAGLLGVLTLQARAQDAPPQPEAQAQPTAADAVGGQPATMSMSGGPAHTEALTRADVYQQLVQSQKNGDSALIQGVFKGN
ncbi:hypothetical protein [Paraburkholderia sp. BCC1884]|uniref:hypothetical protein n=1 Tax=Paraburkholderia sp. BCC1884 TaxID=2562668 RepID=UPI0011824BFA|nr:hypothetical protein [Paraburkholderia sp. BCC1884]